MAKPPEDRWLLGAAKVDITPDYPIRLSGYAVRNTPSEGVIQRLWAKAIALGHNKNDVAVLVTVDNCGVPGSVRDEVASRVRRKTGLAEQRLAICSTHTHSSPYVRGFAPNLFLTPLSASEQANVDRYTRELTEALERVILEAMADRRPGQLTRGLSSAGFAANRRTKDGPVDRELPALFASDLKGNLRAVLATYACHCTTVTGESNVICGDWAGYAQEAIEQRHPGVIALISLGCAGDANPNPRPGLDLARQHGDEIASGIERILTQSRMPVYGKLGCALKRIPLPYDTLPSRAEFEARAKETNASGRHAMLNLARLDSGHSLPVQFDYVLQTWTFGDNLAMVFMAGEVVVDYSLRLKREFDPSRLWLMAYANDVPCYIPSERILKEGGYEGGGAMIYYDKPTRLASGIEKLIVDAVHSLVPSGFLSR